MNNFRVTITGFLKDPAPSGANAETLDVRHFWSNFRAALIVGAMAPSWGCGSHEATPTTTSERQDQLAVTANKLATDPDASPEARTMAAGVGQQIQNDKAVEDFSNGR